MATTPTRPAAAAATLAGPDTVPAAALSSPAHIIELADQLSACADQIHERVMKEIRSYQGGPVPEGVQATARALLEDETLMRQRANSLYADAAAFIVNLVLCIVLIPRFGIEGAGASTSAALIFESIMLFIVARRRLGLHVLMWGGKK